MSLGIRKMMLVINNNTLNVHNFIQNTSFRIQKRGDDYVITFTDNTGQTFTVAVLDPQEAQQMGLFLIS